MNLEIYKYLFAVKLRYKTTLTDNVEVYEGDLDASGVICCQNMMAVSNN